MTIEEKIAEFRENTQSCTDRECECDERCFHVVSSQIESFLRETYALGVKNGSTCKECGGTDAVCSQGVDKQKQETYALGVEEGKKEAPKGIHAWAVLSGDYVAKNSLDGHFAIFDEKEDAEGALVLSDLNREVVEVSISITPTITHETT